MLTPVRQERFCCRSVALVFGGGTARLPMTSQRQVAGRASCASMWRFKWQQCKLANPGLGELQNDAVTVCRVTGLLRPGNRSAGHRQSCQRIRRCSDRCFEPFRSVLFDVSGVTGKRQTGDKVSVLGCRHRHHFASQIVANDTESVRAGGRTEPGKPYCLAVSFCDPFRRRTIQPGKWL